MEEAMATHSSTLAWKIQWTEEPGSRSVAAVHGVARSRTRLSDFTFTFSLSCIGEGNDNPVFLPGESQGWGSLVGCRL